MHDGGEAHLEAPPRFKPRFLALLMVGEFVGTFIANFLTLGIIQSATKMTSDAQTQSLMGSLNPLVQVPPAIGEHIPGNPALAPQTKFGKQAGALSNNTVQPASTITFPQPVLMLGVGVALAYAIALQIAPHRQLNPTFTVAMAFFGDRKWRHVAPCILAQMSGGILACFALYSCTSGISQCRPDPANGAIVCGAVPKVVETAALWGVSYPPVDPFTWRPGGVVVAGRMEIETGQVFWNNILFTALMVIAIIPVFAGKQKVPEVAVPLLIAVIILPFVIAQAPFGVQNNAAMFISGLIFCSIVGYPAQIWSYANYYSAVVVVSPFLGAAVGVGFLKLYFWLKSEKGPLHELSIDPLPQRDVEDASSSVRTPFARNLSMQEHT